MRVLGVLLLLLFLIFSIIGRTGPLEIVPGGLDVRTQESPCARPPLGWQLEITRCNWLLCCKWLLINEDLPQRWP